jgi:hypothetical protein
MAANPAIAFSGDWANIPTELQSLPQWFVSCPDTKRPLTYSDQFHTMVGAEWKTRSHMLTFERAVRLALGAGQHFNKSYGIGIVLTAEDPYVIIDLDDKIHNPATDADKSLFGAIVRTLDSYTEISSSGRGAHIIVHADGITTNFRRDRVECYSSNRFMILTGNVVGNRRDIRERSSIVSAMVSQMNVALEKDEQLVLDDAGGKANTDAEVMHRAESASNGAKFATLYTNETVGTEQFGNDDSKADAALMQMLWFHSRNKCQTFRLFMASARGKREKCQKRHLDYVVGFTLRHAITVLKRDEEALSAIEFSEVFFGKPKVLHDNVIELHTSKIPPLDEQTEQTPVINIAAMIAAKEKPVVIMPPGRKGSEVKDLNAFVPVPEAVGKLKILVDYFEAASVLPTREMATAAAIATVAGIVGAAYQIPGKPDGLNQYFIVVARSATGKESMGTSISNLRTAIKRRGKVIVDHRFDFAKYGSPKALFAKGIFRKSGDSFLHVSSEWGSNIAAMKNRADAELKGYQTIQLEMYNGGAMGKIIGGNVLQDKETTTEGERGPMAYSILSETNPYDFINAFANDTGENGFMSRITAIEYPGEIPEFNDNALSTVPDLVAEIIEDLEVNCMQRNMAVPAANALLKNPGCQLVDWTDTAKTAHKEHREKNRLIARGYGSENEDAPDDIRRHLHTRANLKMLRTAALLAVLENPVTPRIELWMIEWSTAFINHSMNVFLRRYASGDIGPGANKALIKLRTFFIKYDEGLYNTAKDIDLELQRQHIVNRKFVSARMLNVLTNAMPNARDPIEDVITEMVKQGMVKRVTGCIGKNGVTRAECYEFIDLRTS